MPLNPNPDRGGSSNYNSDFNYSRLKNSNYKMQIIECEFGNSTSLISKIGFSKKEWATIFAKAVEHF